MDLRSRNLLHTSTTTTTGSELNSDVCIEKNATKPLEMKRRKLLSFYYLARIITWSFFVVYVFIPLLLYYSAAVQTNVIFLSFVRWPFVVDFTRPEAAGLQNTYNFYVESGDGVALGVWHTLPSSVEVLPSQVDTDEKKRQFFHKSLHNGLPVVLYAHGNSGTRASSHRVQLYKVLRDLNYHVIAFDYRGYGDSSKVSPTENGVVSDAKFMYQWLRDEIPAQSILIWGHSLGTGVSTKMVMELCENGEEPLGLVLEAPFNNLRDEVRHHPLTMIYRYMPFFDKIIVDGIGKSLNFASDESIKKVTIPILILHAEDDTVIPIELGRRLYDAAVASRVTNVPFVSFVKFDGVRGFGHKYICRANELSSIVVDYVSKCQNHVKLN